MTPAAALELVDGDDTPLVAVGPKGLTRGEVKRRADVLFEAIKAHGVRRALVQSDNPVDLLRALDACSRAGADLIIAHADLPTSHLEDSLQRYEIQYLIGQSDEPRKVSPGEPSSSQVFMMTSGTTGRPKVARHSLGALLARVRGAAQLPANRNGRWLLTYQPTGFAGIQVILTALVTGGLIIVPDKRTPAGFYTAAQHHGATQISGTPTFWRSFLMVTPPGALDLRQITLGGEAVDQVTLDRVKAAFPNARVTHIYASTEAGVVFAVHDGQEGFPRAWLDRPAQGVELRIRDEFLHIRSPNLMQGYVSDTPQPVLPDGWLVTADRCEITGDRVRILGRQDFTINVGGSKVYPLAVETFLLGLPGVVEARVFGTPNPITGALVAADIVLGKGEDPAQARIRILAACREQLPGYQVPRLLKVVDAIKVHASGKKA